MQIISNKPFDIQMRCGQLVVLCTEQDRDAAAPLCEALGIAGYSFRQIVLCAEELARRSFIRELDSALEGCACLVPVLTEHLFAPGDLYATLFWYALGYTRARLPQSVLPYVPYGDGGKISATPLKNQNLAKTVENLLLTLATDYSGKILQTVFYNDHVLNAYASRRILYRRLVLRFSVSDYAFMRACRILDGYRGADSPETTDAFFGENLRCGCKIISFGTKDILLPQFVPYAAEIYPDRDEVPRAMLGRNVYHVLSAAERAAPQSGHIHAVFTVDLLVPVHRLFGVYLKPYLKFGDPDCMWLLPLLFDGDFGHEQDLDLYSDEQLCDLSFWRKRYCDYFFFDEEKRRMYFPLGLPSSEREEMILPAEQNRVGRHMEYLFPQ